MGEAAIIAVATAISEVAKMIGKISEGQSPEFKKQMWDWFLEDIRWWRALFPALIPPPPRPVKGEKSGD